MQLIDPRRTRVPPQRHITMSAAHFLMVTTAWCVAVAGVLLVSLLIAVG
jgi:hypothetical protein